MKKLSRLELQNSLVELEAELKALEKLSISGRRLDRNYIKALEIAIKVLKEALSYEETT